MIQLHWETGIDANAERVFTILLELRDYERWLPRSAAFKGTIAISEGTIAIGTTYTERGPLGTRYGKVTELIRPTQLNFEQPMVLRPRALGVIGIRLFHTLTPKNGSIQLVRRLELSPRGPVRLVMPLVVQLFRTENERMLSILKDYAENGAGFK
jgi:hypothetical protein